MFLNYQDQKLFPTNIYTSVNIKNDTRAGLIYSRDKTIVITC